MRPTIPSRHFHPGCVRPVRLDALMWPVQAVDSDASECLRSACIHSFSFDPITAAAARALLSDSVRSYRHLLPPRRRSSADFDAPGGQLRYSYSAAVNNHAFRTALSVPIPDDRCFSSPVFLHCLTYLQSCSIRNVAVLFSVSVPVCSSTNKAGCATRSPYLFKFAVSFYFKHCDH